MYVEGRTDSAQHKAERFCISAGIFARSPRSQLLQTVERLMFGAGGADRVTSVVCLSITSDAVCLASP